jgi:hypothetical protein
MEPAMIGVATLSITQAVTVFHQFLPPLTDIRRTSLGDTAGVMDVRIGELASASLVVGIGGVLSWLMKSHEPLLLSVLAAAGLIGIYEFTLRSNPE